MLEALVLAVECWCREFELVLKEGILVEQSSLVVDAETGGMGKGTEIEKLVVCGGAGNCLEQEGLGC